MMYNIHGRKTKRHSVFAAKGACRTATTYIAKIFRGINYGWNYIGQGKKNL